MPPRLSLLFFDHPKKGRKFSRNLGCYYVTVDVEFAGRKVRLFFTKGTRSLNGTH